ncbi:MAG: hypothetical protein QXN21_03460 [Candidatus Bathyarchaeia archaeon]
MSEPKSIDIFQLLLESSSKKARRSEILSSLGIKEYFIDGDIEIDKKTCRWVDCQLCIKVCPTNALYWSYGQVNITKELCIHCTACVLICMVDNCIKVTRRRSNDRVETFSNPKQVFRLLQSIGSEKRLDIVNRVFQLRRSM